ncbi:type II toxin-antitoxin system Phd/YefM family antitoxin [Salinarimonas rosea]|uniref:type II toxin-antitoxin system Phd/YefM family antitoxin n=1 Tax=Salinarimonas rosea TaxID=552063 RepID=UPI0005B93536|nr:type II toxin-antitoxin system Phd/YefM family antitoxin [Salinarimonas rosea]
MKRITCGDFRDCLEQLIEEVCATHTPLAVTHSGGESVVVMSAEDYAGLIETVHLLEQSKNLERLAGSVAKLDGQNSVGE